MTGAPFYAKGLNFSCKRCSACCRYEAGFVYLCEKDMERLAEHLEMDKSGFIKTYCRWVADTQGEEVLSLKEKYNFDCIFWKSGCTVYQARPLQCRTFPFWESVVSSAGNWEMAASGCPGINSGELHTEKAIGEYLKLHAGQPIINKGSFRGMYQ